MCSKLCYAVGGAPYQTTGCALGFFLQIYLLDVAQVRPEPEEREPGAGLGGPEPPVPGGGARPGALAPLEARCGRVAVAQESWSDVGVSPRAAGFFRR